MEQKTHWKKNIDANFISGEDMQAEIKGLRKEMAVKLQAFSDKESFDQSKNAKTTVTGLNLVDLNTNIPLPKPVILNKTNARFFEKEFGSVYMEDWVGKPVVVYAQPDKRFGFVVRFKKYFPPRTIDFKPFISKLEEATTKEELVTIWTALSPEEKAIPQVLAKKDELKNLLK